MPTMTTKEHIVGVSVSFTDKDGKPAKIDVQDRQPKVTFSDPTVQTAVNILVAANGESMTYDVESGIEGVVQGTYDLDVNLLSGQDTPLVLPITDDAGVVLDWAVTPGGPGPVAKAGTVVPAATPKP